MTSIVTRKRSMDAAIAEHGYHYGGEGEGDGSEPMNKKMMMMSSSAQQNIQRAGKWTLEEETLANQLVTDFENGLLEDCEDGTTLRSYLARKLSCAPMRISKKFAKRQIGKLSFIRRNATGMAIIPKGIKKRPSRRLPRKQRNEKSSLLTTDNMATMDANNHNNMYSNNGSVDELDEEDDSDGTGGGVTDSCSDTDEMAFIDDHDPFGLNFPLPHGLALPMNGMVQPSYQSPSNRSFMMSFMNTGSSSTYGLGTDHERGMVGVGKGVGSGDFTRAVNDHIGMTDDGATTGDENDKCDSSDSGGSPNGSVTTASHSPRIHRVTVPSIFGSMHTMPSVETHEQGLARGQGLELVPNAVSTIIDATHMSSIPESEHEIESQGVVPDDDWIGDVFTLLCDGEDEGHGLV